jgi:hypothetical protein
MSNASAEGLGEVKTGYQGKNTKASPNAALDDTQRDGDISPSSDKQHVASPNAEDTSGYGEDSGSGRLGYILGNQVADGDDRESFTGYRAQRDRWDEEERSMKAREDEEWALKRKEQI